MQSFWDGPDADAKVEQLKTLVDQGLSFSTIANIMGASSRNVVLCKANRLRLANKHPSGNNRSYKREPIERKPKPVVLKAEDARPEAPLLLDGEPITLETITDTMCRYPLGDPQKQEFSYCGQPRQEKSRYCEAHHAICCRPPPPARPANVRPYRPFRGEKQFA